MYSFGREQPSCLLLSNCVSELSITNFSLSITHGLLGLLTKALTFLRDAESAVAFEHSFAQGLQTLPTAREEQHEHKPAAFVPIEF